MAFGGVNTPGILSATPTRPGLMLPEDKAKLDGIASGAQVNVLESVKLNGVPMTPSNKAVNIPLATENAAGLMSAADKTKLDNEVLANLQTVTKSSLVAAVNELCNSKASARDTITFYVAVDGDDTTGDGSAEHPFASLEQAIDKLNDVLAKSTIYIKAGTYNISNKAFSFFKNTSIIGAGADQTILNVQQSPQFFMQFNNGGMLAELTINFTENTDSAYNPIYCYNCILSISNVYFNGLGNCRDIHCFLNDSGYLTLHNCRAAHNVPPSWSVACWTINAGITTIINPKSVPEGMYGVTRGNEAYLGGYIRVKGTWGAAVEDYLHSDAAGIDHL